MRRRFALLFVAALVLTACVTVPSASGDALTGRLSVRVEGPSPRSISAVFDLRGDATRGELALSTPIGTTLAQARWQPGDVLLLTQDGEQRFADLDALTREVLGESLPLGALFDWLRGRPWAGAPSQPLASGGFEQLGWQVDLGRFADGQVDARREQPPAVSVRARLDPRG